MSKTNQGLVQSFMGGYEAMRKIKKNKELEEIAKAEEERLAGDTTFSGMTGSLDQEDMPREQKIKFLGQEYNEPLSDSQKDKARLQAMSGVLSKYGDPTEAIRLRQQATQADILERQNKRGAKEDERATKLEEADNEVAEYMKSLQKMGADGKPMSLGDEDFIKASKLRTFALGDRGLFDEAMKASEQGLQYASRVAEAQTKERTQAIQQANTALLSTGDTSAMIAAYNKYVPDGSRVTAIEPTGDGKTYTIKRISEIDGSELPSATADLQKLAASMEALVDPKALTGYIQNTLRNDIESRRLKLSENADRRAGAAEGRAASREQREIEEKAKTKQAARGLYAEQNPNASNAQLQAVEQGVMPAYVAPKADNFSTQTDPLGRNITRLNKSTGEMEVINSQTGAVVTKIPGSRDSAKPPPKIETQSDAEKAAKDAVAKGASKEAVNARLRELGFKPLP